MAYNADNEIKEELCKVDKNSRGDVIVASRITTKTSSRVQYDIRNLYTDANGELKPTSKGIRLASEQVKDVMVPLIKSLLAHGDLTLADITEDNE